ncbi:MAG TPA: response regulator [Pilimelia sp.]|nr:response regulator [Pilimelia sp.]
MARVLVVDDEPDVRDLIVRRLRADGHDVTTADNAPGALAAVAIHGLPDAAVLDVDLPGMDGVALLAELRRLRPDLPAVFLTVLWSGDDVARMRLAGGIYVAKPFTAASLRGGLREALATATPERNR